jgi:hypothetical protein
LLRFFFEDAVVKNLQEATERICDLKGSVLALDVLMTAILDGMSPEQRAALATRFAVNAEVARTVLLHEAISDQTLVGFERDARRIDHLIQAGKAESSI